MWRHCNISQTVLHDPVVACGLGHLYNKDALIMALLDKTLLPETAGHIKSIKVNHYKFKLHIIGLLLFIYVIIKNTIMLLL